MYSYYVNQNIYLTIRYLCVIVQSIYLFVIHKAKRSTQTRGGASGFILGVSSFLFCSVIGGVERGESTGTGADNRSI